MEQITPGKLSTLPYGSPEMLDHMRRCEAREWLARFHTKARKEGMQAATLWWSRTLLDIEALRGKQATMQLRQLMNQEKKK